MSSYTGTDNLEVMAEAVKYNAFLVDLVVSCIEPAAEVLDFGAGIGTFADQLRTRGWSVRCLEPDMDQAAHIESKGFTVYRTAAETPDRFFDLIYSLNVLEHIEDDVAAARMLYEKLKPGGRMLIYVPAFQFLFSSMDEKVGHHRRYDKSGLITVLRRAGFEIDRARYVDSAGFFASIAYKIVGDKDGNLNPGAIKLYDRYIFPVSLILDRITGQFLGKNLLALARRPA